MSRAGLQHLCSDIGAATLPGFALTGGEQL